MKTVLVTGADGMLGVDLIACLEKRHYRPIPSTIAGMDVVNPDQVNDVLSSVKPDIVIHAAAYTAVDRAESEKELCMAVNRQGTRHIALACQKIDAELVYISTDYVFDGTKASPYVETDTPNPINVYGESKYLGEREASNLVEKHKICRSSWLLGLSGIYGANFLEKIFHAALAGNPLKVVSDQRGSPTFTFDLASLIERILEIPHYGVFHLTNSGDCSWFELAKTALEMNHQSEAKVIPVSTAEFPRPANRPLNSVLASPRLATLEIPPLRPWREALREYILERNRLKGKNGLLLHKDKTIS